MMKTIYNAQGETKQCDAVDAREHIATGRWFADAPAIVLPEQGEGVAMIANALSTTATDGLTEAPVAEVATHKRGRK